MTELQELYKVLRDTPELFPKALVELVKQRGSVVHFCREIGIPRITLYKMNNPSFFTVLKIMKGLDLKLSVYTPMSSDDYEKGVKQVVKAVQEAVESWENKVADGTVCKHVKKHDPSFDAYYCTLCLEWLEKKCMDPSCMYCPSRPDKFKQAQ